MLITVYASICIVYFLFNGPISGSFFITPNTKTINKLRNKNIVEGWGRVLNWSVLGIYLVALSAFGYMASMIEKKNKYGACVEWILTEKTKFLAENSVSLKYYSDGCLEVWRKSWSNEVRTVFILAEISQPTRCRIRCKVKSVVDQII